MNKIQAREKVLNYLNIFDTDYKIMILENSSLENEQCCLFYYNTEEFIIKGDSSYALAGNNPILVNYKNGLMYYIDSSVKIDLEELIKNVDSLKPIDTSFL